MCEHCEPAHGSPHRTARAVTVGPERDGDGQPVRLYVAPAAGAHVAKEDAQWLREVIRSALARCDHSTHGGAGYA